MVYLVYTDGAVDHQRKVSAYGCFIRTKREFILMSHEVGRCDNIAITESHAVCFSIEKMLDKIEFVEGDRIEISTDSQAVINFFKGFDKEGYKPRTYDTYIQQVFPKMLELHKSIPITMKKINAHEHTINGNKVIDRVVKWALRSTH